MLVTILVLMGPVSAQMPKVQVTFQMVKGTPFYNKYKADTSQIKQDGLLMLRDSLNQYLPFIEFTTASAANKLNIKIDQTQGSEVIKEYYWFLTFTGPSGQPVTDQWLFLKPAKFHALQSGATNALMALRQSWGAHLKTNYDLVLVHNMFREIPIDIKDSQYYYSSANRYELILPYTKREIKLFPGETKFKVEVTGISGGSSTELTQDPVSYAGEVDPSMGKPTKMSGCIRLRLEPTSFTQFTSGKVYFTKYRRDFTVSSTTPGSFIDNNQTP
jgi:hypothetical protein